MYFWGESFICICVFVGKDYVWEYNNGMKVKYVINIGRGGGGGFNLCYWFNELNVFI